MQRLAAGQVKPLPVAVLVAQVRGIALYTGSLDAADKYRVGKWRAIAAPAPFCGPFGIRFSISNYKIQGPSQVAHATVIEGASP